MHSSTDSRVRGLIVVSLFFLATSCLAATSARLDPADNASRPMTVRAAHHFSNGHGWAANATHVMVTADNGKHWRDVTPPAATRIQKVYFRNPDQGWVVSTRPDGDRKLVLLNTGNGGDTWVKLPPLVTRWHGALADSLSFLDAQHGWMMLQIPSSSNFSMGRLLMTDDGGVTWTRLPHPPAAGRIRFTSVNDGTLTGGPGKPRTWVTHDGGSTWHLQAHKVAPRSTDTARARSQLGRGLDPDHAIIQARLERDGSGWALEQWGKCKVEKSQCGEYTRLLALDGRGNVSEITPELQVPAVRPHVIEVQDGEGGDDYDILGFDKCAAAPASYMDEWWNSTPWVWTNIYIGGENRGCSQSHLDSGWVDAVLAIGFTLVPTWVGPQAPGSVCDTCSSLSSNASTAYQQGINEADAATQAANNLGLYPPTIIYYDMEAYSPSDDAAVNAFISGWVKGLHDNGNQAGVYGSPYQIYYYAGINHVPDAIWPAQWNNNSSVYAISQIPDSWWNNHQRFHQYRGGHDSTYGGITFNIDSNGTDGPTAAGGCSVTGHILPKYQAMGGAGGVLGGCTTSTNPTASGGQYNHFQNGSIYWKNATLGAHELHGSISDKWNSLTWELGPLGYPITDQLATPYNIGAYNDFEHGAIYKTSSTGTHAVYGGIFTKWDAIGRVASCMGYPTSDVYDAGGGVDRVDFQYGYITKGSGHAAQVTCSCTVEPPILSKYNALGGDSGILGHCTTDTNPTADGGSYNHFDNGSIYYSAATGTHEVHGAIADKWYSLQWEVGIMGYPISDEIVTADAEGRFNEFETGVIYWSPATDAHEVHGAIFSLWDSMRRVYSCLGYPSSDEYDDNGPQRNDFQLGYITWTSSGGALAHCQDRIYASGFHALQAGSTVRDLWHYRSP